ncbi:class I SAM-dependent methyltransferase [Mesorhizobium sp.]|uniref:class I SAM-dependent methyltransferase n=1 Tax=Mesorhizobium sp. TaxID=1871066 RepID=UPI00120D596B|nr:class I SAM-dependent methyltransferase [Mesorhizobium sp.]TIS53630.1 MAG: class I SAM-dependent methyltransferase [Mesorhizobium sp.]TIS85949.1 MAG: class I SAM-dependent methyltransferase [Mesorhizobium sp.]
MSFYQDYILPHLINLAMRNAQLVPYRERTAAEAEGRVLEIGIGSGLNLPFYGPQVREVMGLEPSSRLIEMARGVARESPSPVTFIEGSAEAIPLERGSIDTVVTTWTLCTIPHAIPALEEMRRVLRPGGQLLFVEHGLAPEESVRKWQNRLTPFWRPIAGGCHLNRPISNLIETAGFSITALENSYVPKAPRMMGYLYQGRASP